MSAEYPLLDCPVLGFAAFSGTGKTTLIKQLIPLLHDKGINIGVIKHTHHDIEPDQPGKDSYELRHAGAQQTILAGSKRWSLITETTEQTEPVLSDILQQFDQQKLDLILVEGFRDEAIPKIELHRSILDKPFIFSNDKNIIAIACDDPSSIKATIKTTLPILDINNPADIAEFIMLNILSND